MKKFILLAVAPLALVAGCSSEQADTNVDDATTTQMPADGTIGTTGDAAGTMPPADTGTDTMGTTDTNGSSDTTTDQMEPSSGPGSTNSTDGTNPPR